MQTRVKRFQAMVAGLMGAALLFGGACGKDDPEPIGNSMVTQGQAVAKFCHDLTRSGARVALTLDFGNPVLASITAATGSCSPSVSMPCASVPVGIMPARLRERDMVINSGYVKMRNGFEYIYIVDVSSGYVDVAGQELLAEQKCASFDLYNRDAGAGDGGAGAEAGSADDGGAAEAGGVGDAPVADATVDAAAVDAATVAPDAGVTD